MADLEGVKVAKTYHTDIPFANQNGFYLKGCNSLDWGMKRHMANIFNPKSGNTVMFAFDHGYFMGSTSGLERLDLLLPKLAPYVDCFMGTRGAIRTCVPPELTNAIALRVSSGSSMLSVNEYGFLLLDLGLPGVDGMTVLRTLRANAEGQKKNIPVIILTARDGLDDRLEGLDAGADDYLVKPFHMSELLARIRAVLRRKNQTTENALTNGLVTVNVSEKTATVIGNSTPIVLSRREYALLAALLARPGTILSRRRIEERIYEPGEEPESNAVEYLIHSLRKKLGPNVIKNVRGLGWMVEKGSSQ